MTKCQIDAYRAKMSFKHGEYHDEINSFLKRVMSEEGYMENGHDMVMHDDDDDDKMSSLKDGTKDMDDDTMDYPDDKKDITGMGCCFT